MKNLFRFLFIILIAFELLNWVEILNFELDFSWLGLVGISAVIWLTLELVEALTFLHPPRYIWLGALLGVYLDAISDVNNLYTKFKFWDRTMHFLGGAIVGVIVLFLIIKLNQEGIISLDKRFIFIAVLCVVSFLGFMYEMWEFLIDRFYFGFPRALGDGPDTVEDMFLNIIGAATSTGIYIFVKEKFQKSFLL